MSEADKKQEAKRTTRQVEFSQQQSKKDKEYDSEKSLGTVQTDSNSKEEK